MGSGKASCPDSLEACNLQTSDFHSLRDAHCVCTGTTCRDHLFTKRPFPYNSLEKARGEAHTSDTHTKPTRATHPSTWRVPAHPGRVLPSIQGASSPDLCDLPVLRLSGAISHTFPWWTNVVIEQTLALFPRARLSPLSPFTRVPAALTAGSAAAS